MRRGASRSEVSSKTSYRRGTTKPRKTYSWSSVQSFFKGVLSAPPWIFVLPVVLILVVSQVVEEQSASPLSAAPPPSAAGRDLAGDEVTHAMDAMDAITRKARERSEEARIALQAIKVMEKDPETNNERFLNRNVSKVAGEQIHEVVPHEDSFGHNTAMLSELLFGMFEEREFRSIVDFTCRKNAEWIRPVLKAIIARADDKFRYYCLDEDEDILKETIPLFKGFQSIYFVRRNITGMRLPQATMVLVLDLLQTSTVEQGVGILEAIKKNVIPMAVISHNPGRTNPAPSNPTDEHTPIGTLAYRPINLKAEPFGLGAPDVVFDNLLNDYKHKGYPAQLFVLNVSESFPFHVEPIPRFV